MLFNPYAIPLLIAAGVLLSLALYAVPHRAMPGARAFMILTLAAAGWSSSYVFELSSLTLESIVSWANFHYIFIGILPAAWLTFAIGYTRSLPLSPRLVALLAIVPGLVVIAAWTNDFHHLFRVRVELDVSGPFPSFTVERGPVFWIHTAYSYSLILIGAIFMLQSFIRSPRPYRSQSLMLLFGALFPFAVNILSVFSLNPITALDLTPFAFAASALAFFWSLFRYQLLDLFLVPRHSLIDNLVDGVLVLDLRRRIVDLNPAAARLLGARPEQVIGAAADSLLERFPSLSDHLNSGGESSSFEIQTEVNGENRCYDVQLSLLKGRGQRVAGNLIVWHDITARRRAEQDLADFFTLSVDMIGFANLDGYFTRVNSAFEWTLGWTAEEMLKTPYIEFVHPADAQKTLRALARLDNGDSFHSLQNRFRCKDGSYRWLSWSAQRSGEGRLYAIARDITDLKQIEIALRESGTYLELLNEITRTTVEKSDFGDMLQTLADQLSRLFNADGCFITLWDETQQRTIPAAAYGKLQADYRALQILPGENTMTASVLREGRVLIADDVFNTPYISPRIAALFPTRSLLGLPLVVGDQKLGAALITFDQPHRFTEEDVFRGAQVAAQIALAIAKTRLYQTVADERGQLRALIESSRDGIILTGMDRCILVINQPTLRMLGLPRGVDDWIGRSLSEAFVHLHKYAPEVVKTALAEMRRIARGDEPVGEGEYQVPPRIIHWSNLPVRAGDKPLGRLIVLRDVTEERSLEKMRETLTHTMVHDLRNPLSALYTGLDVLDIDPEHALSPDQQEALETVRYTAQRMLNLVNSILDVTRLEKGEMPLARARVALADVVMGVFKIESSLTLAKRIRLEKNLPPDLPMLYVDVGLVRRVLQNLIDNAIKFTSENGVIIVSAQRDEADDSVVEVAVKDSGGGIPPEVQNRLFQKFVTGRQIGRGSGMGLAFCKLAVEAHGGRIWLESSSPSGATFKFTLPAVKI